MIAGVLTGYLLGSLPLGYLMGRWFGGVDLRAVGSRNVGATNVYRTSGLGLALAVMSLDLAKGVAAVVVASRGAAPDVAAVAAGVAAVTGHVYPVWLKGHGGKGVATACGAFAVLAPMAMAIAMIAFVIVVWVTRVVSLGSVAASLALPIATAATRAPRAVVWGAAATAVLVVWRHRSNLARVRLGTERRLTFRGERRGA